MLGSKNFMRENCYHAKMFCLAEKKVRTNKFKLFLLVLILFASLSGLISLNNSLTYINLTSLKASLLEIPSEVSFSLNSPEKKEITWDDAVECSDHGFNGTLLLTKKYGKNNLTPQYDANKGPSTWLYPDLLSAGLSMYKITHRQEYMDYARRAADSLAQLMLNDKNIIRMYSRDRGASELKPTSLNYYLLPTVADLAIYDPSYRPLAQRIADGIIDYGISKSNIPYGALYPSGKPADISNGLPSNQGDKGTIALTVIGLLRTYEATGNSTFLNKSHDILISVWNNKRTRYDLVPTEFNSDSLSTINSDTQMYATGELLRALVYYYYITHDPEIKDIISRYSTAACKLYWGRTSCGSGYFMYKVDVDKGRRSGDLLETNWHKLDMSLLYAGEITNQDFKPQVYEDMNTYWLGKGLVYVNHLFRHGTKPDGSPAKNAQSLIYASLRTSVYIMLRMLDEGAFQPSNQTWNEKVWDHVQALRSCHWQEFGYHSDVDVSTLKPDSEYYGLGIEPACGEFASLVTLIFRTTPNVKMAWETFPKGDFVREPFSVLYSDGDPGFMSGAFMDYAYRVVAFKDIISQGPGKLYCTQEITEVRMDGLPYSDWQDRCVNLTDGKHEYAIVFYGGSYISPQFPKATMAPPSWQK